VLYINGERVPNEEIDREIARLRPQYERTFASKPRAEREAELREWSSENVIEQVLLRQAARRDPERVPPEGVDRRFRDLVKEYGGRRAYFAHFCLAPSAEGDIKRSIALELKVERLVERIQNAAPFPTEDEIRANYEACVKEYTVPEIVRAAHIVKHVENDADRAARRTELEALRGRAVAGEDFGALAREHSDSPENGGDLGFFFRGRMSPAFDAAVFPLETGAVSPVFETELGLHIAKLLERRPPCPATLEDARVPIAVFLANEARQNALDDFLDGEKAKARIEER